MARNKHPEETVAKILDVALELFAQKGYEHTSIQDIVDNLDGLSKGAIYHHFKSKEEIFDAAMERAMTPALESIGSNRDDRELTGAQKVQRLFSLEGVLPQLTAWKRVSPDPDPIKNARLLGMEYANALGPAASDYLLPIIEQGNADGSIACKHPRETAEALSLLADLWLVPLFREPGTEAQFMNRLDVLIDMAAAVGIQFDRTHMEETARAIARVLFDDVEREAEEEHTDQGGRAH